MGYPQDLHLRKLKTFVNKNVKIFFSGSWDFILLCLNNLKTEQKNIKDKKTFARKEYSSGYNILSKNFKN